MSDCSGLHPTVGSRCGHLAAPAASLCAALVHLTSPSAGASKPSGATTADSRLPSVSLVNCGQPGAGGRLVSGCGEGTLAPMRHVKLVRRGNEDDGTDCSAACSPRGRVHLVASSAELSTRRYTYRLRQVAGAIVLFDFSGASQYGAGKGTSVKSLRTGRKYEIASSCSAIVEGTCDPAKKAPAAFVNSRGQAAAAIVAEVGETTTIAGFSRRGQRQDLASVAQTNCRIGRCGCAAATSLGLTRGRPGARGLTAEAVVHS